METSITIAEILKTKKPIGLKLYSSTFGYIKFNGIYKDKIYFYSEDSNAHSVKPDGKMYDGGECIIFPSKEMRDWSKFTWKRGDVLVSNDNSTEAIFDGWYDDTYTSFYGKHYLDSENENNIKYFEEFVCTTERYFLEDKDVAQTYINTIEERLDGKLNRETLEIEKQPEFKDGDIAFADYGNRQDVFIVSDKTDLSEGYSSFISLDLSSLTLSMGCRTSFFKKDLCKLRLATEEEKQQLFDALANENKAWDAEKKEVVDLKPKWTPKPFDKVVVRCGEADKWSIDFFSYKVSNGYICTGDAWFGYCLPYNEETVKLIGTRNNVEGQI